MVVFPRKAEYVEPMKERVIRFSQQPPLLVLMSVMAFSALTVESRATMAMEFTIKPLQSVFALQEPLLVELLLTNDQKDLTVPVELENVDVVTFYLLDTGGKVVAQGDGYSAQMREGLRAIRKKHDNLQTWTYEKGLPRRWQSNVLRYLDVPAPGDYAIKATFTLPDQKVALESATVPITVHAGEIVYLDAWRDDLPMAQGFIVHQVRSGSNLKTVITAPGSKFPLIPSWGGSLVLPSAREPKIAEGGHANAEYEDRRFRWMAWLDGKRLKLVSIDNRALVSGDPFAEGMAMAKPAADIEFPSEDVKLIGHPVQHEDLSVSVYTAEPLKSGTKIRHRQFDRTGKLLSNTMLLNSDEKLMPVNSAFGYIAAATAGGAPVYLLRVINKKAQQHTLLQLAEIQKLDASIRGDIRILYLAVDVSPFESLGPKPNGPAVVGVFVATTGAGKSLFIVNVPLDENGVPQPARAALHRIANSQLPPADELLPLQVIHDQRLQLHALFATTQGGLWHVGISGDAHKVADAGTPNAKYARLYETSHGYLYALFPTRERGIAQHLLQKSNPFQ